MLVDVSRCRLDLSTWIVSVLNMFDYPFDLR